MHKLGKCYTYLLINTETGNLYAGATHDPKHRLNQHKYGMTPSSAGLGNPRMLELIATWEFRSRAKALRFESFLAFMIHDTSIMNYVHEIQDNDFVVRRSMLLTKHNRTRLSSFNKSRAGAASKASVSNAEARGAEQHSH